MAKYVNASELLHIFKKSKWNDDKDKELAMNIVMELETRKDMWIVPDRIKVGDSVKVCDEYFKGASDVDENKIYTVEALDKSGLEMGDTDYLIKLTGVDGYWFSEHFMKI